MIRFRRNVALRRGGSHSLRSPNVPLRVFGPGYTKAVSLTLGRLSKPGSLQCSDVGSCGSAVRATLFFYHSSSFFEI
jgi:hypothetical protein